MKSESKRDPERRKRALIEATLDTIAEIGISETTISKIIERAALSRGMINLHFGSKNDLLTAAAKAFSDEYYAELDRRIALGGSDPADVVMAVIEADMSETLMNERSTKIWHAFRGEAGTNAGVARYSNTRDKRLREIIHSAFDAIASDYETPGDKTLPRDAAFALLALLEGMWVDYLSNPNAFSRADATAVIRRVISRLFPRHF